MPARELVGREHELAAFGELIARAAAGERAVVMLVGEPGIGKTRLCEELAARATAAGFRVAFGRTVEIGLTPAFWPWRQAFAQLAVGEAAVADSGALLDEGGAMADTGARLARFAAVGAALARAARVAPIALVFDDVHAADPSSLELVEYVLPMLVGSRVLLALAARDAEAETTPAVAGVLGRIQRSALRLPLGRLGRAEVAALVGDRANGERVFEVSEGNPLFVEELLASLRAGGGLELPRLSSMRGVIRERTARLPGATRAALGAAAVVGRDFRGAVVAEIAEVADAAEALQPALALGIVTRVDADRYRFSHALVTEALAGELPPSDRARMHLRAARALERLAPDESSAIAHHLIAAGGLAAEAAVTAAEHAGRRAAAQLAFEDAAQLFERALAALQLAAPGDRHRRASLVCARAEALQHATRHADAAAALDAIVPLVRELADAELLARVALVRGMEFRFGQTDAVLVALLEEALAGVAADATSTRAKLIARLAAAQQPAADPRVPAARALEAIALAEGLSRPDRMQVLYVATSALVEYVAPAIIEPIQREILALAGRTHPWVELHTRCRLCYLALERLDRAAFQVGVTELAARATAIGLPRWQRQVCSLEALIATLDGRFAEAAQRTEAAAVLASSIADRNGTFIVDVQRAFTASVQTAPHPPSTQALLANLPPGHAVRAWFALQAGDEEAVQRFVATRPVIPFDPDLSAMVGLLIAHAGSVDQAEAALDTLAPRRGQIVLATMVGSTVIDLFDRVRLRLATRAQRWDVVEEAAASALAVAAQLASPVWTACVEGDLAEALAMRAQPGDLARASALWERVQATATRLGMPGLAARAAAALATSPTPTPSPGPTPASISSAITFEPQGALWLVCGLGESAHVKDSRGVAMLAKLVAEPGRDLHALELAGAMAVDAGDAGPALDATAREAYRARIVALHDDLAEAERWHDAGRTARLTEELEALHAELERAFGLGGRERRVGSAAERARSNAQRRIAHAIAAIRAVAPALGAHLAHAVTTGTYCRYAPVR